MATHNFRQDYYTQRLPSPPRMTITPPVINDSLQISGIDTSAASLFGGLDLSAVFRRREPLDWTYSRRHQVQEVLSFLWLGPHAACKDSHFLADTGITMVLVVRNARGPQNPAAAGAPVAQPIVLRVAESLGIHTYTIDIPGNANANLTAAFSPALTAINTHLAAHKARTGSLGKVLLTCSSGNDRSAAIAVAYVLEISDLQLEDAVRVVQNQRFCVSLDEEVKFGLKGFEDVLRARRDVAGAGWSHGGDAAGVGMQLRHSGAGEAGSAGQLDCRGRVRVGLGQGADMFAPAKRKRGEEMDKDGEDTMMTDEQGCGDEDNGASRRFAPFA